MKKKFKLRSVARSLSVVAVLASIAIAYQNCGTVSSYNINSNSSAGTINNTAQVPGPIALGSSHSCAITTAGGVQCWGYGASGQLGNGNNANQQVAVNVTGVAGAVKVSAGYAFTCALLASGVVDCWGDNSYGQLGNNTQTSTMAPVVASVAVGKVFDIATVYQTTCVVLQSGTVQCWGKNANGELGQGTNTNQFSLTAVDVVGITNAVAIAGGFDHFCALLSTGAIDCWGSNSSGQLGNGTSGGFSATPVAVSPLAIGAQKIGAGVDNTCAIMVDQSVQCWGDNTYGALGNGSNNSSLTPVAVTGLVGAKAIAVGYYSACAVLNSGSVQCWGYNNLGELGNNTANNSNVPVTVQGVSNVTAVGFGYYHACGYVSGSAVSCWGYNNYGQVGNNTLNNSETAVSVVNF